MLLDSQAKQGRLQRPLYAVNKNVGTSLKLFLFKNNKSCCMQRILLDLVDSTSVLTLQRSGSRVAVWLLIPAEMAKLTRWGLIEA